MLPKQNRLTKENSKGLLFQKKIPGKFCLLLVAKSNFPHPPRLTVVVSKKVSLRAVDRNWAKRIIRDIVAETLPSLPKSLNIIIRPNKEIISKEKEEISKEIKDQLLVLK